MSDTETPADRARHIVQQHEASPGAVWTDSPRELHAALVQMARDLIASEEAHEVTRAELHETKIRLGAERYEVERLGSVVEHRARQTDEARAEASRLRALLEVPFPTLEDAEGELRAAGQDPAAVGRRLRERIANHIIDGAGQTAAERARDLVSHMRAGDLTSLAHELGNILVPLGTAVARLPEDEHRERAERCMARLWALSDAVKASLSQDQVGARDLLAEVDALRFAVSGTSGTLPLQPEAVMVVHIGLEADDCEVHLSTPSWCPDEVPDDVSAAVETVIVWALACRPAEHVVGFAASGGEAPSHGT